MRWKALLILAIILAALFPAYLLNKYLQKVIRPRESLGRLFLYMMSGMLMVFLFTLILVYVIKLLFPGA